MRKKVLGLVISKRKLGNSEILLKEIMKSIPEDCDCELIRLTELKIEACSACYICLQEGKECKLKDDFNYVFNKIIKADALLIGVPIYLLGPHGCYKMFTDRILGSVKLAEFTANKPCVLVVPFGIKGWEGYARAAVQVLPRLMQMKVIDCWQVKATLPAESLLEAGNLEYAQSLGKRLFKAGAYQPGTRECPFCGSDLFRLFPGRRIECPICGSEGFLQDDNVPIWPDPAQSRFTAANLDEHFNGWLKEMKHKFHEEKARLKEAQSPYRHDGWWVKPY